jgi:hypothetical protein
MRGYVAQEMRSVYEIVVRNTEGTRQLVTTRNISR